MGASGKLGKSMVQHALDRGYEVVGVCRDRSVNKLNAFEGRITLVPGETNNREVIKRAVADNAPVDCVDFKGVPSGSYTCKLLDHVCGGDLSFTRRKAFNEYYVQIPTSFDIFLKGLKSSGKL